MVARPLYHAQQIGIKSVGQAAFEQGHEHQEAGVIENTSWNLSGKYRRHSQSILKESCSKTVFLAQLELRIQYDFLIETVELNSWAYHKVKVILTKASC